MDGDSVTLDLDNLSPVSERQVLIQAGCYGEHTFTTASYAEREGDAQGIARLPVQGGILAVTLLPGCEIEIRLGMDRYVHEPRYAFPWRDGAALG
jgi:hypothetical protein